MTSKHSTGLLTTIVLLLFVNINTMQFLDILNLYKSEYSLLTNTNIKDDITTVHNTNKQQPQKTIKNNSNKTPTPRSDQIACEGNRFQYLSNFLLQRQQDLTLTFIELNKTTVVEEVIYKQTLYRTYKIFNFKQNISYSELRQTAQIIDSDILRVTGGNVSVYFSFEWQKVQLGISLFGNGTGQVKSDSVNYQKLLKINQTRDLQWHIHEYNPLTITNGLSLKTFQPYKPDDYNIIGNMLTDLGENRTTVKKNLLKSINSHFQKVLTDTVLIDPTHRVPRYVQYSYSDYRGQIFINFTNSLQASALKNMGLNLIHSQVIPDYPKFQCGDVVPDQPNDPQIYGGLQEFISNSFLKSVAKFAVQRGLLDVVLTQEFWQSRAFQFFMGDVHQIMPKTKNISTSKDVTGKCKALLDRQFSFGMKSSSSYQLIVNFTCNFNHTKSTKLLNINQLITYEIKPVLNTKTYDFVISSISTIPIFIEVEGYKIQYMQLAQFMLSQTVNTAIGTKILGSGYKTLNRRLPNVVVKEKYLFLYDASYVPPKSRSQ